MSIAVADNDQTGWEENNEETEIKKTNTNNIEKYRDQITSPPLLRQRQRENDMKRMIRYILALLSTSPKNGTIKKLETNKVNKI